LGLAHFTLGGDEKSWDFLSADVADAAQIFFCPQMSQVDADFVGILAVTRQECRRFF
jgi:hypothetical protein